MREANAQTAKADTCTHSVVMYLCLSQPGAEKLVRGSKNLDFFCCCFSHQILRRGEDIRTNILSGPLLARQRNVNGLMGR